MMEVYQKVYTFWFMLNISRHYCHQKKVHIICIQHWLLKKFSRWTKGLLVKPNSGTQIADFLPLSANDIKKLAWQSSPVKPDFKQGLAIVRRSLTTASRIRMAHQICWYCIWWMMIWNQQRITKNPLIVIWCESSARFWFLLNTNLWR